MTVIWTLSSSFSNRNALRQRSMYHKKLSIYFSLRVPYKRWGTRTRNFGVCTFCASTSQATTFLKIVTHILRSLTSSTLVTRSSTNTFRSSSRQVRLLRNCLSSWWKVTMAAATLPSMACSPSIIRTCRNRIEQCFSTLRIASSNEPTQSLSKADSFASVRGSLLLPRLDSLGSDDDNVRQSHGSQFSNSL